MLQAAFGCQCGKKWKRNFLHPPTSPFFATRAILTSRDRVEQRRSIHSAFPAMYASFAVGRPFRLLLILLLAVELV